MIKIWNKDNQMILKQEKTVYTELTVIVGPPGSRAGFGIIWVSPQLSSYRYHPFGKLLCSILFSQLYSKVVLLSLPQFLWSALFYSFLSILFHPFLGKDAISKTDEFSEKFQTAFDPPPHFRKIMLRFLRQNSDKSAYVQYGGTVVYYMILFPMRCM